MDKFWEWMEEKEYIIEDPDLPWFIDIAVNIEYKYIKYHLIDVDDIPKQMLIGYMIEYVKAKLKAKDISWVFSHAHVFDKYDEFEILKELINGWEKGIE